MSFDFLDPFFSRLKKQISQKKNTDNSPFQVRDIPEGSIIQIFDEHENQYEFTVHDHNRYGSFVRFTKFNEEDLLGETHSKVVYPQPLPSSKFSIEMENYKKQNNKTEKEYSIQNITHIKILEKK